MDCTLEKSVSARSLFKGPRDDPHAQNVAAAPFLHSRERLRARLYLELAAVDLCMIAAAFLTASVLHLGDMFDEQTVRTLGFILPIFLVVAMHNRSYSQEVLANPRIGARRAGAAMIYVCALVLIGFFALKISADFSRFVFVAGTGMSVSALILARLVAGSHIARVNRGRFANKLLLVDDVEIRPDEGEVVLFVDSISLEPEPEGPAALQRIGALLEHCEAVCVACSPARRRQWAQFLKGAGIDVEFVMPELTELNAVSVRSTASGETVITSRGPLALRDRIYKRSVDLLVATCAILMFAVPMLAIAVAIKIDSPGPILFRQQRVGKNNRLFQLLKFRSMRLDCSDVEGQLSTSRRDPRVTRVGRFIRQTSLDELPQLFNVLRGDMSIVGPRPHALASTAEDLLFWQIDGRYFHRHAAKPGLTGLAQIRGYRGATMNRLDLTNRLSADLEYLSGWSLSRDLKIMLNTFRVLVHGNAF